MSKKKRQRMFKNERLIKRIMLSNAWRIIKKYLYEEIAELNLENEPLEALCIERDINMLEIDLKYSGRRC